MPVKTHTYSNKDITIVWKPEVCIHSKICWHGLRAVFDPVRRPWILPDAADTATIMAQIDQCPSGALSYTRNSSPQTAVPEQAQPGNPPLTNIECLPNGPLLVNGPVVVKRADGTEEIKTGSVALCRCGASNNKPYCDGNHRTNGFLG
ncbi:MAG TPA: (4Fe-4S)-binding protein [Chitinophagaceae bacterium]|nr:(4Fe-4S)-binding protein [Chitinophagaceae bacterium]